MSNPAEIADILDLLTTNERVMADLYEAYERKIPAMAAFWKQLVIEERAHADVMGALRQCMQAGKLTLRNDNFDKGTIRSSIARCMAKTDLANTSPCHPVPALETAISMEREMIEREFFDVFTAENPAMIEEFVALKEHTRQHIGRIAVRLLKEQARIPH